MKAELLARSDLPALAEEQRWPCVSVYAPITRDTFRTQAGVLQLRHLAAEAHATLTSDGWDAAATRALLEPVQEAIAGRFRDVDGVKAEAFVFFGSPGSQHVYLSPFTVPPTLLVNDHFELRPVLDALRPDRGFYVLSISQNHVRLCLGSNTALEPVPLPPGTPTSLAGNLGKVVFEPKIAYHAVGSGPGGVVGKRYGEEARDNEDRILVTYVDAVCHGVRLALGTAKLPLVVVAVDPLRGLVRERLSYGAVLGEGVDASPDEMAPDEILRRSLAVVKAHHAAAARRQLDRYLNFVNTKYTAATVQDILQAAGLGQIDTLLVAARAQLFGSFDRSSGRVDLHEQPAPHDTELVSATAQAALMHAADVFVVPDGTFPAACPMGAVLRW